MKLYYLKGACSLASYISLCEGGIKFDAAAVDRKTRKTSDGEDFNQINPKGYVPVLRLDNGRGGNGREVRWGGVEQGDRKAAVLVPLLTQPGKIYDVSSPTLPTIT